MSFKIKQLVKVKEAGLVTNMVSGSIEFAGEIMVLQQLLEDASAELLPYDSDPLYVEIDSFIVDTGEGIEHVEGDTNYEVIGIVYIDGVFNKPFSVMINDIEEI